MPFISPISVYGNKLSCYNSESCFDTMKISLFPYTEMGDTDDIKSF